jgi:hypothetical protein
MSSYTKSAINGRIVLMSTNGACSDEHHTALPARMNLAELMVETEESSIWD